jgi:hypothetical protein
VARDPFLFGFRVSFLSKVAPWLRRCVRSRLTDRASASDAGMAYQYFGGDDTALTAAAATYMELLRERRDAELALKRARQEEVEAKRQWHERARKAADFKSKFRDLSDPCTHHEGRIAFRCIGLLQRVGERDSSALYKLHVSRAYARGLRGIDGFDAVWVLEAHELWGSAGEAPTTPFVTHSLHLRLYNLLRVERLPADECILHLRTLETLGQGASTEPALQVVDVKPYIPNYDALHSLEGHKDTEGH